MAAHGLMSGFDNLTVPCGTAHQRRLSGASLYSSSATSAALQLASTILQYWCEAAISYSKP